MIKCSCVVVSTGFADRRWVSPMLLSPLWGSLLVSYGIGPVVTRTSDIEPLAGNILAFLAVGFGIYLLPLLGEKGSMGKALLVWMLYVREHWHGRKPPARIEVYTMCFVSWCDKAWRCTRTIIPLPSCILTLLFTCLQTESERQGESQQETE